MSDKNTTPEFFDEEQQHMEGMPAPTKEEVLLNEAELLTGLLELGQERNNPENYKLIEIRRSGVLKLQFRLRPMSESEMGICRKRATTYTKAKGGQPKKAIETNMTLLRSLIIYSATVDEDRKKVWDNPTAKAQFNVFEGHDMVDIILLSGEKDRIIDELDTLNGYNYDEAEATAKN